MTTFLIVLSSLLGPTPGHALFGRVGSRASMTCAVLLRTTTGLRTHAVAPHSDAESIPEDAVTTDESSLPDPIARPLIDATYDGPAALTRFRAGVAKARAHARADYVNEYHGDKPGSTWRAMKRMFQYPLSPVFAYFSLMSLIGEVRAMPELINSPWEAPALQIPAVVGILVAIAATGLYDYSLRWLSAYDLSLWRIERGLHNFRTGKISAYHFTHDFYVTRTFAAKLAEGRPLAWADIHAQNVREEMPGLWRWFAYRKDAGAAARRLRLEFDARQVEGTPRLTVRLVELP